MGYKLYKGTKVRIKSAEELKRSQFFDGSMLKYAGQEAYITQRNRDCQFAIDVGQKCYTLSVNEYLHWFPEMFDRIERVSPKNKYPKFTADYITELLKKGTNNEKEKTID